MPKVAIAAASKVGFKSQASLIFSVGRIDFRGANMASADDNRSGEATPDERHSINKRKWRKYELERAHELSKLIALMVQAAMRFVSSWLKDNAELDTAERYLIEMHVEHLRAHSAAIKEWEEKHKDLVSASEADLAADGSPSWPESKVKAEDGRQGHNVEGPGRRSPDSVDRNDSILHNRISDEQVPLHSTLAGLDKSFLQSAAWFGPTLPSGSEERELRMVRLPNTDPDPCSGAFVTAVDGRLVGPFSAQQSRIELVEHWAACLDHIRPSPLEWHKSGAVVWDYLASQNSSQEWSNWTAEMFNLVNADDATNRACQAALLGAFLTGDGAVRLEVVKDALATFIHAHPCFKTSVEAADWHLPYGKKTLYRVGHQRTETARKGRRKRRR